TAVMVTPSRASSMTLVGRVTWMPSIVTLASLAATLTLAEFDRSRPSPASANVVAFEVPDFCDVITIRYDVPSNRTDADTPAWAALIFAAIAASESVLVQLTGVEPFSVTEPSPSTPASADGNAREVTTCAFAI